MNLNVLIRQSHRWLSIAFTLAAIANIIPVILQSQAVWIGLVALLPLVLLVVSGLYLFALPYVSARGSARRSLERA